MCGVTAVLGLCVTVHGVSVCVCGCGCGSSHRPVSPTLVSPTPMAATMSPCPCRAPITRSCSSSVTYCVSSCTRACSVRYEHFRPAWTQAAQSGRLRVHFFFSRRHRSQAGRVMAVVVGVFAVAGESGSPGVAVVSLPLSRTCVRGRNSDGSGESLCTRKRCVAKAGSVEEKLGGMSPVQTRKRRVEQ